MTTTIACPRLTGQPAASRVGGTVGSTQTSVLLLVGGVPGAGKTTLLDQVREERPDVLTLDSESVAAGMAGQLPAGVPYRVYRPLVHLLHVLRSLAVILRGPSGSEHAAVLVHDPATRPQRRRLTGRLARWRGWRTALVVIDVSFEQAVEGQRRRVRVVPDTSFGRHWRRWEDQRSRLAVASTGSAGKERSHRGLTGLGGPGCRARGARSCRGHAGTTRMGEHRRRGGHHGRRRAHQAPAGQTGPRRGCLQLSPAATSPRRPPSELPSGSRCRPRPGAPPSTGQSSPASRSPDSRSSSWAGTDPVTSWGPCSSRG